LQQITDLEAEIARHQVAVTSLECLPEATKAAEPPAPTAKVSLPMVLLSTGSVQLPPPKPQTRIPAPRPQRDENQERLAAEIEANQKLANLKGRQLARSQ